MRHYGEGATIAPLDLVKQKIYATLVTLMFRAIEITTRQAYENFPQL